MARQHGSNHWIKVQKHTPDKPEMRYISRACSCSLGDAFLAWFRVYGYFDESTEDGSLPFFTAEDVDDVGRLPGLGNALASVGWLLFDTQGCTVVNWERHNGQCAKTRLMAAERQDRHRNADVTQLSRDGRNDCHADVTRTRHQTRPYQPRGFPQ